MHAFWSSFNRFVWTHSYIIRYTRTCTNCFYTAIASLFEASLAAVGSLIRPRELQPVYPLSSLLSILYFYNKRGYSHLVLSSPIFICLFRLSLSFSSFACQEVWIDRKDQQTRVKTQAGQIITPRRKGTTVCLFAIDTRLRRAMVNLE